MARCYNCGSTISDDEKTLLCDNCQRIMLPFIKLTGRSNTSSVRRLLTNEKNLRNMGVTDHGMEYLLRICELNDRTRAKEREDAARQQVPQPVPAQKPEAETVGRQTDLLQDVEIPEDEPLELIRKPYGALLPAVKILLIAAGLFLAAWFVYRIAADSVTEFPAAVGAVASFCGAYLTDTAEKLRRDLEEIKKRFL